MTQTVKGNQPPAALSLPAFLYKTFVQHMPVNGPQPFVDGGVVTFNPPPSGMLSKFFISLHGTITVAGTVTAGTWNNWFPAPFGLVKNVSLTSNQNLQIRSHSLWALYVWLRERYGIDPFASPSGQYSSTVNTLLGIGTPAILPGAAITATTYPVNLSFEMPIAYNDQLVTGLLVLQNNNIAYPLTFNCGNVVGGISATGGSNDLINGLTGTGLSVTQNLTFEVTAEICGIPQGNNTPRTNMFMSLLDQNFGALQAGQNVLNIPQSDLYTMFIMQAVNAGVPVDSSLLSNIQMSFAGNLLKYNDSVRSMAIKDFYTKRIQPVNGSMVWDMGMRGGLKEQRDMYEAFNDQQVTGLQLQYNIPATTTVSGTNLTYGIMESLRLMQQVGS